MHVVELDRRLEAALRDATDPHPNVTLHLADAVKLDLAALDPAPTKVVANLPYGVAATVILRTVEQPARGHDLGGDGAEGGRGALRRRARLAAPTGSRRVLAQLACDVKVIRPVSRNVFFPVPNVDSVLVRLLRTRRRRRSPALRALVQQGFAHRRKALAALGRAQGRRPRRACARRWRRSACPPTRAPRRSRPTQWRELHARLA